MAVGTAAAEGEIMAGLLDLLKVEGAKYLRDILPGGLLNPEGAQIAPAVRKGAEEVRQGLLAYGAANKAALENPTWDNVRAAVEGNMTAAGMAPLAMTVWHGSPHKFDKFDMSKIGTGEGAQAYGHGLYMAESPEVAQSYKIGLTNPNQTLWRDIENVLPDALKGKAADFSDAVLSGKKFDDLVSEVKQPWQKSLLRQAKDKLNPIIEAQQAGGALYKVDIPDEAVARFLDWDKPLSQQSNEAVGKARAYIDANIAQMKAEADSIIGKVKAEGRKPTAEEIARVHELQFKQSAARGDLDTAGGLYQRLSDDLGGQDAATKKLQELGIPGIRYLDGGSRSAGQGSSNFVLFDDQMPRILEINGAPTGLQPWGKGEWRTLRGLLE